jgi:hypothetical protein
MKGLAPSPTVGFRNRIAQKYKVIIVPEKNTTKTCSRCLGPATKDDTRIAKRKKGLKNLYKRRTAVRGLRRCDNDICKGLINREQHMESIPKGPLRWNRDHNAAINIRSNFIHFLQKGVWHPCFKKSKPDPTLAHNEESEFTQGNERS